MSEAKLFACVVELPGNTLRDSPSLVRKVTLEETGSLSALTCVTSESVAGFQLPLEILAFSFSLSNNSLHLTLNLILPQAGHNSTLRSIYKWRQDAQ